MTIYEEFPRVDKIATQKIRTPCATPAESCNQATAALSTAAPSTASMRVLMERAGEPSLRYDLSK
jgi:hypothetical protein